MSSQNKSTKSIDEIMAKGQAARAASRLLSRLSTDIKNRALLNIAAALESQQAAVLEANREDYAAAQKDGMNDAMLDRLLLSPERLAGMAVLRLLTSLQAVPGLSTSLHIAPRCTPTHRHGGV